MNIITLPSGRKIGEGQPPFIIAEIGSNWRTFDDCLLSIRCAKAAGADAVKFQLFDELSLYGVRSLTDATDPRISLSTEELEARGSLRKTIPGQLNHEWLPRLKAEADRVGIEFMCSAFSPDLIDVVDPFVNIHKVASAEICHVRMLEKLKQIGKPIFLSCGAQTKEDISRALDILGDVIRDSLFFPIPIVLMYCIAAYPAKYIGFKAFDYFKNYFEGANVFCGFSDHSLSLDIPILIAGKACLIEKHVNFIECDSPDAGHSLNEREFRKMVQGIRDGCGGWNGPTSEEQPMILRHKRRLIATQDIKIGDVFEENKNFGIYRSLKNETHAYGPFHVEHVNGKQAAKDIKAGDGIGPGDL